MKIGWLIYEKRDALENETYIDWFIEEASLQNLRLNLVYREQITNGILNNRQTILVDDQQIKLPDFAIVRTIEPILNFNLEACNIKVFNSAVISQLCNHKSLTHQAMNTLGIPMVDTLFSKKSMLNHIPPFDYPFVIKEATGRSGKQVFLIKDHEQWLKVRQSIKTTDVVIQKANVQFGKDVRVFVIGQEIIGAVLRENNNDFRANFKLGGTAKWYPLNTHQQKMIQKIINHFEFGMVGIDFLLNEQGDLLFNEIEDVVGSRILSAVTDINLLEKYVTYIKDNI